MRFVRLSLLMALLFGAGASLSGCTGIFRRSAERRVASRLAEELGPAEKYRVEIQDTSNAELVRGRARRVEIEGRRIFVQERVEVETLQVVLRDLRYDRKEPYSVSIERSDLRVEFTEAALNNYLRTYHARYRPEVRFLQDRVEVSLVYPFLGTPTPIHARGRLIIDDGKRLLFRAEEVDLSILDRPGFEEQFVEDRVNPLLDLNEIEFPARLESVQVLDGRIRAHGAASLPRVARK